MITLPVLTLWQPWASLCFVGPGRWQPAKRFETRSFPYPERLHLQRIAIHAAAAWHYDQISPQLAALSRRELGENFYLKVPYGAILGTVRLVYYMPTETIKKIGITWDDDTAGDWTPSRFGWRLCEPERLTVPIPWKGKQGWGSFPADLFGPL